MRLGIRRKLIGTLMLVGLFPLVMSLVVILGGGAAIRIEEISEKYRDTAAKCSDQIADGLLHEELEKLVLISRLDQVKQFVRSHNPTPVKPGAAIPQPSEQDRQFDKEIAAMPDSDPRVADMLHNEAADRLRLLSDVDLHPRFTLMTNAAGETIAAVGRGDNYFQAGEAWWQAAFNEGRGRLVISSVVPSAGVGTIKAGEPVVEIVLPIYDSVNGQQVLIGILREELGASWLFEPLRDVTQVQRIDALTLLVDLDSHKTVYAVGATPTSASEVGITRTEKFVFAHDGRRQSVLTLLFNDLVVGWTHVDLNKRLVSHDPRLFDETQAPNWAVIVSQGSGEAMEPVYKLAWTVAGIGIALILVLFILGVAISNREIIMPILRLREATAAVGRGELNVRLLSREGGPESARHGGADKTFRKDELGELAKDFDEMTRQLQRNVNQLARSNEAKRRFMELAGHELRTPVTYLLGVCQLAQKQLQQLAAMATDGEAEDEKSIALAGKSAGVVTGALSKIAAKTARLSRIIDNLLKLVNNDQFTTRLVKEPVDVRALILQVTADHRPFIVERKQQLIVDVSENLPSIEADRDKLEDALTNLVSNAIRFSPDGTTVRVSAHEIVGDMLEILVEDSGPGIPSEDVANLFEPFYTGSDILHHHSGTFEYGSKGIGLGLAIVRRFIELHGGVVRAHSITREGKVCGTQFQILLPLMKADAGDAPPAAGA